MIVIIHHVRSNYIGLRASMRILTCFDLDICQQEKVDYLWLLSPNSIGYLFK